jgi:hypothetical protein
MLGVASCHLVKDGNHIMKELLQYTGGIRKYMVSGMMALLKARFE